jgi:hypothetical protein
MAEGEIEPRWGQLARLAFPCCFKVGLRVCACKGRWATLVRDLHEVGSGVVAQHRCKHHIYICPWTTPPRQRRGHESPASTPLWRRP